MSRLRTLSGEAISQIHSIPPQFFLLTWSTVASPPHHSRKCDIRIASQGGRQGSPCVAAGDSESVSDGITGPWVTCCSLWEIFEYIRTFGLGERCSKDVSKVEVINHGCGRKQITEEK